MSISGKKSVSKGPAVVVEIGAKWLKIVQCELSGAGMAVSKMHLEKFESISELSQVISTSFKAEKFAKVPVIGCLPRDAVNIRMLDLPSTDPAEIADMIDLQAGKLTPYSKSEIVSDYRIVGSTRNGYTKVMLAIVQRSVLREHYYVLEDTGIDVGVMTVSSEGILGWMACDSNGVTKAGGVAVLDIDATFSDLTVFVDGQLAFTRCVRIGADQLMSDPEQWRDKLAQEVKHAVESCHNELPGLQLGSVYVVGAGHNIDGIVQHMGAELDIHAVEIDSMECAIKKPTRPSVSDPVYHGVSLTTLLGMGLDPDAIEFNMIPDSVSLRRNLVVGANDLSRFAVLLMALLAVSSLFALVNIGWRSAKLESMTQEKIATAGKADEIRRQLVVLEEVESRSDGRFSVEKLYHAVHQCIAGEDVQLTSVALDHDVVLDGEVGKVKISGLARDRQTVSMLVRRLKQVPEFLGVETEGTVTKDRNAGKFKFVVVCRFGNKEQ